MAEKREPLDVVRIRISLSLPVSTHLATWVVRKKNTSGYIKNLIYHDMLSKGVEIDEVGQKYLDEKYCDNK